MFFYALSTFLIAKYFNFKCHRELNLFTQAVGTTVDFAKGLWYQNGNATPISSLRREWNNPVGL